MALLDCTYTKMEAKPENNHKTKCGMGGKWRFFLHVLQNPLNLTWKQVKPVKRLMISWWHIRFQQNTQLSSLWELIGTVYCGRLCYKDDCCFCSKGPVIFKCHILLDWDQGRKVHRHNVFNPLPGIFFIAQQQNDLYHPSRAAWGIMPLFLLWFSFCDKPLTVCKLIPSDHLRVEIFKKFVAQSSWSSASWAKRPETTNC